MPEMVGEPASPATLAGGVPEVVHEPAPPASPKRKRLDVVDSTLAGGVPEMVREPAPPASPKRMRLDVDDYSGGRGARSGARTSPSRHSGRGRVYSTKTKEEVILHVPSLWHRAPRQDQ